MFTQKPWDYMMLNNFTQINKIYKKKYIYNNPIWLIASSNEKRPPSYNYEVISNSTRQAIIVNIDSSPESDIGLESTYKFKKRHLIIDKVYNKLTTSQHGLYSSHYTEEYLHETDGSSIKVHVYLDKNNQCIYIQAKRNDGVTKKIIELPYQRGIIKNSKVASKILQEFLIIRKDNYLQAMQRSHVLEKELCDLIILCLNNKLTFKAYYAKAHEFIILIEEINSYLDDSIDMRGKIIENILIQLCERMKISEVEKSIIKITYEKSEEEHKEDIKLNFTPFLNHRNGRDNKKEKDKLLTKLNDYSMQLDKLQVILEKVNLLQNIKNTLLILTFNEELIKLLSRKEKKFISKLEERVYIKNNIPEQLYILFLQACFEGNLDKVKQLFIHVYFKIDFKCVHNILEKALSVQADTQESVNIIKVMDYLHEQSPAYRMFLPLLSDTIFNTTTEGIITKISQEVIFNFDNLGEFFNYEEINLDGIVYKVLFFPLFKAIYTNNMPLFKMLLAHGMLANSFGAIALKKTDRIYNMSLTNLRASCLFKCDIKFIKLLYDHQSFLFRYIPYAILGHDSKYFINIKYDELAFSEQNLMFREYSYKFPLILFLEYYKDLKNEHIDFFKHSFMQPNNFRDLIFVFAFLTCGLDCQVLGRDTFNNEADKERILFCENYEHPGLLYHFKDIIYRNIRFAYFIENEKLGIWKTMNMLYQHLRGMIPQQSVRDLTENINLILYLESKLPDLKDNNLWLIRIKYAHLKAALLCFSFKEQLTESDLKQVHRLFVKIFILYKEIYPGTIGRMKEVSQEVLCKIKAQNCVEELTEIESEARSVLQFYEFKIIQRPLLHTCEPPYGSVVIEGKTIVPKLQDIEVNDNLKSSLKSSQK